MREYLVNGVARFHGDETGQGLVEYELIIALIALAAMAGMNTLASSLNSAFTVIGSIMSQYLS